MKLKMKNFTPAIVLGVICLIVAALLATINHFTAPIIEENERLARTASLRAVFGGDSSGADFGEPMKDLPDFGADSYVSEVFEEKNGKGYAITLVVPKGFEGEIDLTVGVDAEGKVTGVVITKYNDSIGKDKMPDAVNNFVGKDSADGVELVSGATYSSTAVRKAVSDALAAVKAIKAAKTASASLMSEESGTKSPRVVGALDEEKVISLAKEMLDGASGFEFVKTVSPEPETEGMFAGYVPYKAHIYKETSGKGYAVHGESFNEWSFNRGPEANFVFVVDKSFAVIDFDLVGWSLSPGYNDELSDIENPAVKRLEESFIGVNLMNFSTRVDLVTEATLTSVRIEDSVRSALEYLDQSHEKEVKIYKAVGTTVFFAAVAAFGVAIYFTRRRRV